MGRKTTYQEIRIAELTKKAVNWAIEKWAGLSKPDRIRILTTLAPKYIERESEKTNVPTYITNIITNIRQGKELTESERNRISERIGVVEQMLSNGQSVQIDRGRVTEHQDQEGSTDSASSEQGAETVT